MSNYYKIKRKIFGDDGGVENEMGIADSVYGEEEEQYE